MSTTPHPNERATPEELREQAAATLEIVRQYAETAKTNPSEELRTVGLVLMVRAEVAFLHADLLERCPLPETDTETPTQPQP